MFDDTIKNNISYAKENATDEEIKNACKFAAADEFIEKLPNRYETVIGKMELDFQEVRNKGFQLLGQF